MYIISYPIVPAFLLKISCSAKVYVLENSILVETAHHFEKFSILLIFVLKIPTSFFLFVGFSEYS